MTILGVQSATLILVSLTGMCGQVSFHRHTVARGPFSISLMLIVLRF